MTFPTALRLSALASVAALVLGTPGLALAESGSEPAATAVAPAPAPAIAEPHDHSTSEHPGDPNPGHVDPAPPGVDVSRDLATDQLLLRWEARQERKADEVLLEARAEPSTAQGSLESADGPVPTGTSALPGLTSHVSRSCAGTGSDGNRVQPLYVVEADDPDRFDAVLPLLRDEVANIDDTFALSAAETGGVRRVRWVFSSTTTCEPVISKVIVPAGSLANFGSSVQALQSQGFTSRNRKYLVFADTSVYCGVGHIYRDDSPVNNANDGHSSAMFARVDTACWQTSSSQGSTPAHELMHNIGGVQTSAPHPTPYGHCTDRYELMCYNDGSGAAMTYPCPVSHAPLFDCRSDDYFSTAPAPGSYLATRWNTANSSFLDAAGQSTSGPGAQAEPVAPAPAPPAPVAPQPVAPGTPASVTIEGPSTLLPGLPGRLLATGSAAGTYSWSLSDPDCLAGPAGDAALNIRCSVDRGAPLTATVTFVRSDGDTASASHTVAQSTQAATLTQTLAATSTSIRPGRSATLTARLTASSVPGAGPVRGRVRVSGSTDGKTWKVLATDTDTGSDGAAVFVLRPSKTVFLRLSTPVAASSGWSVTRDPVVRLVVGRAPTTVTMVTSGSVLTGRLVRSDNARAMAGRKVALQYRSRGMTTWRTLRVLTTSRTGRLSAKVKGARGTSYRWHYAGSSSYLPDHSAAARRR